MTPLLSIVVPTKNRYIYLFELIKLLASFKRTDFEMVIQDNSTNNKQFIDNINLSVFIIDRNVFGKDCYSSLTLQIIVIQH